MTTKTWIKGVDWIIAWDSAAGRHAYLKGGDLVMTGNAIEFVGPHYGGTADTIVDGGGLMAMPGLVDIHAHPSTEPFFRGIREEHGVAQMYMSGLFERSVAYAPDLNARRSAGEVAYCEMLLSGITTVADLSAPYPGWLDLAGRSGLRVFLAPSFTSARWQLEDEWRLAYKWDEAAGKQRFREAMALIAEATAHPSGRLGGIVSPAQIDTCTPELLRDGHDFAREGKLPFTTHCAQAVNEVNEMVRRHGKTPIQWARDIGVLGPGTILGHAIFTDEHSWIRWHGHEDVRILAETGTAVAHCPSPFARYGQTLEDFGRYLRAGVTLGLGTDVSPHNLIEEMRLALILARIASEDIHSVATADLFHAGTAGGAAALGRPDLGKLAPGAKADVVLVDLRHPLMMPARDPLRSLVYTAADRAVRDVYVDGTKVVENGRVLTLDHQGALEILVEAQKRMEATVPERDFRHRRSEEISPLSLPLMPQAVRPTV